PLAPKHAPSPAPRPRRNIARLRPLETPDRPARRRAARPAPNAIHRPTKAPRVRSVAGRQPKPRLAALRRPGRPAPPEPQRSQANHWEHDMSRVRSVVRATRRRGRPDLADPAASRPPTARAKLTNCNSGTFPVNWIRGRPRGDGTSSCPRTTAGTRPIALGNQTNPRDGLFSTGCLFAVSIPAGPKRRSHPPERHRPDAASGTGCTAPHRGCFTRGSKPNEPESRFRFSHFDFRAKRASRAG